jgi:hypothetical protein
MKAEGTVGAPTCSYIVHVMGYSGYFATTGSGKTRVIAFFFIA